MPCADRGDVYIPDAPAAQWTELRAFANEFLEVALRCAGKGRFDGKQRDRANRSLLPVSCERTPISPVCLLIVQKDSLFAIALRGSAVDALPEGRDILPEGRLFVFRTWQRFHTLGGL